MPINYRNIDPHKVAVDVMKDRAKEWERRAFIAEMEVKRLEVVQKVDPASGEVAENLMKRRNDATSARGKAKRAAGASPLDPEEAIDVREEFLTKWLTDVEQQHAAQTALVAEGARQLGLKGKDGIKGDERRELEGEMELARKNVEVLEATHGLIVSTLDALQDHPDAHSKNGKGSPAADALRKMEV